LPGLFLYNEMKLDSFLETTIASLVTKYGTSFKDMVFIVPSIRSGAFLKRHIAKDLSRPIFAPQVTTIEQFIETISGLAQPSSAALLFKLYEAHLTGTQKEESFQSFYKWAKILLSDFNEIDRHLIDTEDLFSYLAAAKRIKEWGVQKEPNQLITDYLRFWEDLQKIYTVFTTSLLGNSFGYQGLIYRKAHENIDHYLTENKHKKHFFIGFNALNTSEQEIVQKILAENGNDSYWDLDDHFFKDPMHDAGYFIRKYHRTWPYFQGNRPKGISNHFTSPKKIEITGIPNNSSQAKYIGQLLRKLHGSGQTADNIALILSDETMLPSVLNALPEEIEEVNITMGYPLKRTQLYSLFLTLFDFLTKKTPQGWFHKDMLRLLADPLAALLLNTCKAGLSVQLQNTIKNQHLLYSTQESISQILPTNDPYLAILFKESLPLTPKEFISFCQETMVKLEQGRMVVTTIEKEALKTFKGLFETLSTCVIEHAFINTLPSLKTVFDELVASENLSFHGDPTKGLQIMGMLESRALDFDTVLLTSVNEGILPSGKTSNSFIPFDIKKEFGLPTHKEKDAIYTYHFYRILQRASTIYITYNTEPDVLEGGEKSRLISQLMADETMAKYITHHFCSPAVPTTNHITRQLRKTPQMMLKLRELATQGFSPSSLYTYIRNPYTFYKQYILGISEVENIDETIAPNTFGTIVHDSLEILYKPFVGLQLTQELLESAQQKVTETAIAQFQKAYPGSSLKRGQLLIAFQVVAKYLNSVLAFDQKRIAKNNITILGIEQKIEIPIALGGPHDPVILKGKIDRVENIDGRTAIIDYKTGNVAPSSTEIVMMKEPLDAATKKDKAFQLLCYALLFGRHHKQDELLAAIAPIKKMREGLVYYASKKSAYAKVKQPLIDAQVLMEFEDELKALIQELLDPTIAISDSGR